MYIRIAFGPKYSELRKCLYIYYYYIIVEFFR